MARIEPAAPAPARVIPLAVAGAGFATLAVSAAFGPKAMLAGALFAVFTCLVALREASAPVLTWPNAVAAQALVIWLIPIRGYRLPVELPFNLEPYRLFLLVLLGVWFLSMVSGRYPIRAAGHGLPLLLLAGVALAAQSVNFEELTPAGLASEALKPISYFLSFLLAFVLLTSVLERIADVERVLRALVVGAVLVAAGAVYESRSSYNAFDHLHEWFPLLVRESREVLEFRGGLIRVYASAQHPIALSCALLLTLPLAIVLAQNETSRLRSRLWLGSAVVITTGAIATISRTTVVMLVAMTLVALLIRYRLVIRYWPLILVLPFVVHFAAPGALGGLYKAFLPSTGLAQELEGRAGQPGSGRLADIEPGLRLWSESPLVGHGLGSQIATGSTSASARASGPFSQTETLIFDNQYLNTLVSLGAIGLFLVIWLVLGATGKLARTARQRDGPTADLVGACAVSCAGFAAGMVAFDAFAFVQATLVFFLVAALGLRARELLLAEPPAAGMARSGRE
jgi:hypothetical protein